MAITKTAQALKKDQEQRHKDEYKELRRRSRYSHRSSPDADYRPDSQQPDIINELSLNGRMDLSRLNMVT